MSSRVNATIGADGTAINGVPSELINNIYFNSYGSSFFGEKAGDGLSEENKNNTFVGFNSGSSELNIISYYNTFIGVNAGKNVGNNSSNNIVVGTNNNRNQNQKYIITVGLENKTLSGSLTFGHFNENSGYENIVTGQHNTLIANNSIVVGNNNYINNSENHSNCTIIGHDISLHSNYNLNIDNTFVKYDDLEDSETLFIGFDNKYDNFKTAIGFQKNSADLHNILNTCNNDICLYVNQGIYANNISIGDITSNSSIFLGVTSNITTNIQYYLPDYPENTHNMFLTLKEDGEMYWKHLQIGSTILTTDDLPEGKNNLYFNHDISLDDIQNGVNNNYIKNGIYNRDLVIFGTLTVNKLRVLGVNMKQDTTFDNYLNNLVDSKVFEIEKSLDDNVSFLNTKLEIIDANASNYVNNIANNTRFFIKTLSSSLYDIADLPYNLSQYQNIRYRTFNVSLIKNNILEYSLVINVHYNGNIVQNVDYQILFTQNNMNTINKYINNIVYGYTIVENIIGFYNNMITITVKSGYEITMMSV